MTPRNSPELLHRALEIAHEIVEDTKNPNDGCTELSEISTKLNSAYNLGIFELLAHDQYGHESLGFNAENTASEIVLECQKLLSIHSA